jgi:hypothetical protein
MANEYTYIQLLNRIRTFFDAHLLVKGFSHGDLEFADIDKFPLYPHVHIVPVTFSIDGKTITYTWEVFIFDLPRVEDNKQDNIAEVLSDTGQIAQDFINAIKNGDSNILDIYDMDAVISNADPFWDGLNQKVAGWTLSIDITVPYLWNACLIPVADVTPPTPPTPSCDDATVNVNDILFDTVASGGTLNVPVKNSADEDVGTITAGEVIVGNTTITNAFTATQFTTVKAEGNFGVQRVRTFLKNTPATVFDNNTPELIIISQDIRTITTSFQDGQAGEADVVVFPATATIDGASTATLRIYDIGISGSGLIGAITTTPQIDAFVTDIVDNADPALITAIETEFCTPCADASVTVNSSAFDTVAAGGTLDVPVEYENGTPVGTITAGVVVIPNPVTASDIYYRRPLYSQKNSYTVAGALDNAAASYDEGWHLRNGSYDYTPPAYPTAFMALDFTASDPYVTLASNNSFGNTNRFTAADGTQTFPDSYVVDNLTGLGWWADEANGLDQWVDHLSYSATAAEGGHSDWRIPTNDEYKSIIWENGSGWNGTYFSGVTQSTFWTATTNPDLTTQAIQVFASKYFTRTLKTGSAYTLLVRNHF